MEGVTCRIDENSHRIGTIPKIQPGQQKTLTLFSEIPASWVDFTAIGRCAARYFVLRVNTEMGFCASCPEVETHMIFHSKTPSIMRQDKMHPPNGWCPQ